MKIGQRKRHAVGHQQQVRIVQERGARRHQRQLYGPVTQLRRAVCHARPRWQRTFHLAHGRAGAAAFQHGQGRLSLLGLGHVFVHGLFIEGIRLAMLDGDRVQRASADARAQPVAIALLHHASLAVDNLQRTLRTVDDALSAAVALLFVDLDNIANRHDVLLEKPPPTVVRLQSYYMIRCSGQFGLDLDQARLSGNTQRNRW